MALMTSKALLEDAQTRGYAVGAFNVENMEMIMAIIAAAEKTRSPVILQTTPGTVRFASLRQYLANASSAAATASVPVAMHLDHGNTFDIAMQALHAGYTSIMIDGSKLSFEENIALTKRVTDACRPCGIPVEGELGKVGGKEDDLVNGDDNPYTDPDEAREFVARTEVDSLAVGIGTSHGVYKGIPKVNVERLSEIRSVVDIPLVLHGTSGVPDDQVRDCVRRGICKVNYATDLRIAFTKGIKDYMQQYPDAFDPKKYTTRGMEEVMQYVMQKMNVIGSTGKA